MMRIMNPATPMALVTSDRSARDLIRPEALRGPQPVSRCRRQPGVRAGPHGAHGERRTDAGWLTPLAATCRRYVDHDSVRVDGWTVDFGDGSVRRPLPPDPVDQERMAVSIATRRRAASTRSSPRMSPGEAYAAFFAPAGARSNV